MVSNNMWKNSIGGSKGSADINTHSLTLNDGNLNAQCRDQKGRQASEPTRNVPTGPKLYGGVSAGSNANAKTMNTTAEADKLAKSGKVKI